MANTFSEVVLYFFIYSAIGWIWESIYCSVKAGHFVYRGMLKGPYCPIYGFGVLSVLYFVMPLKDTTLELFVFSAVTVTVLEYFTGYALERFFKVSLWNYDDMPLNIQGRVALPVSFFWGFGCVVIVKYIQPEVTRLVDYLHEATGLWLPSIIIALMLADTVVSVMQMLAFKNMMLKIEASLEELKITAREKQTERRLKREEFRRRAQTYIQEKFPKLSFTNRHIIKTYPDLKIKGIRDFAKLRRLLGIRKVKAKGK